MPPTSDEQPLSVDILRQNLIRVDQSVSDLKTEVNQLKLAMLEGLHKLQDIVSKEAEHKYEKLNDEYDKLEARVRDNEKKITGVYVSSIVISSTIGISIGIITFLINLWSFLSG